MTAAGPWSVKGIDPKAREIAKDLARRSGMTLGEWLNQMIIEGGEPEAEAPAPPPAEPRRPLDDLYREAQASRRAGGSASPRTADENDASRLGRALETLATRVEAAEHRSVLAISGMDQSVMGVLSRLDEIEREQGGGVVRLEGSIGDVRAAQGKISERIRRLESEDSPRTDALKALEAALGRMALRIDEEASKAEEARVRTRDAADEAGVLGHRLERLETVLEAAPAAYADAEKVETVLTRMAERLDQTETRTNAAVQSLQTSFAGLDARLRANEVRGAGQGGAEMERRFQTLAQDLSQRVDASRAELAQRLRAAADGRLDRMETALKELSGHVEQAEKRSAQAIDRIGREVLRVAHTLGDHVAATDAKVSDLAEQTGERLGAVESRSTAAVETMSGEVSRLADAMENRLRGADTAQAEALEKLGGEIARIAERLAERISTSDRRSAEAIDDVTDKVAKIGARIDERHETSASELSERIRQSEERTARLLEEARERLDQRLADTRRWGAPALASTPTQEPVADTASNSDPFAIPQPPQAAALVSTTQSASEPVAPDPATPPFVSAIEDPFPSRGDPFQMEDSPFDADDEFAPTDWTSPPLTPQAAAEPQRVPVFDPAPFDELPPKDTAASDLYPGFSVGDFAPSPEPVQRPEQTSTREMLDAARQAARRAATGGRGDAGPPGSVRAPPLEPVAQAPKPFGITFPGRRKKETAPTLRTVALASLTAGALTTMGVGAYLLGGASHDGKAAPNVAMLEPPPTAAPLGAPAPSAMTPDLAVAVAPSLPAASHVVSPPPSMSDASRIDPPRKPRPDAASTKSADAASAKPSAVAAPSAKALYASAVGRIDNGDVAAVGDLKTAAEDGVPAAQFYLARLYEAGAAGMKKDLGEARHWTQRAANGGDPAAMYNLASYMYSGDGGSKDLTGAASWFHRAAEHGVVNGQYNLAQLYEKGYGVPQSNAEAYKWYLVAAGSGDTEAKSAADSLKAKLPPDVQGAAQRTATELRAQLSSGGAQTLAVSQP